MKKDYILTVKATDGGGKTASIPVDIFITDVNDNAPIFDPVTYSMSVNENEDVGFPITTVTATDKDDGTNGEIMYSIVTVQPDEDKFKVDDVSNVYSTFFQGREDGASNDISKYLLQVYLHIFSYISLFTHTVL